MKIRLQKGRRTILKSGNRVWYLFKITEFVLVLFCLLLLCLSRFMFYVVDDFTVAYMKNILIKNETKQFSTVITSHPNDQEKHLLASPIPNNSSNISGLEVADYTKKSGNEICKAKNLNNINPKDGVKLIDLIVMYPCCSAILIMNIMEIIGHLLQDPFNKWSNLIYLCLAEGVTIIIFTKSIMSSLSNWQLNMICIGVFSGALIVNTENQMCDIKHTLNL